MVELLRRRAMMGAASGEEPAEPGTDWESGVPYSYELVANEYYTSAGKVSKYNGWSRTPYLPCKGASRVSVSGIGSNTSGYYSGFFDENYALVGSAIKLTGGNHTVPQGACYVGFSQSNSNMAAITSITPYA